jgi:radical SAM protein with 4Fe4S-binding SPASM domain
MDELRHIRRVDIELHSFCNRTCDWCPNKTYLRNKQTIMEDWLFTKILKELNEFGFGQDRQFANRRTNLTSNKLYYRNFTENQPVVSFLGYMEPMSDIKLLKRRVKEASDTLNNFVELVSNTSGDYISKKNLEGLLLTTLNVMDYDCKGKDYWQNKLKESGCLIVEDDNIDYNGVLALHKTIGNIRVQTDWPKKWLIENRAGVLSKEEPALIKMNWKNNSEERKVPCVEPTYFINITYDGNVMPCCHLRSDIPMHQDYILGNLKEQTLKEIFYSEKAKAFRERLSKENGDYPETCKNCQKIRNDVCTGGPNGFDYIGQRYSNNTINENVFFI